MAQLIGHRCWAIAEGYIPAYSNGPEPQFTSHETVCILNAGNQDANVERSSIAIKNPLALTRSRFQHDAPSTYASIILPIRSRFLTIPTLPASLNRMLRLLYSTPASIHVKQKMPSLAPLPTPAAINCQQADSC